MARTACVSASATSCASPRSATALVIVISDQRVQLVLEPAGLDRAVNAALLGRVRLPPPAPVAARLARPDRAGAGRAADRGVPALVERMRGHAVRARVLPDLVLRPLGERVQLHDRAVVVVDLDLADVAARRPLIATKPRDPCVETAEVALQRQDLPHLAAEETVLDAPVEEVRAVLGDHRADRGGV